MATGVRRWLVTFALLCGLANAGASTPPRTEPPEIAALRASQDRSATVLRDQARALEARAPTPLAKAWAQLAIAEFENDREDAAAALRLLDAVLEQARALRAVDLEFAALVRQSAILVNRGRSAETESVLAEMQRLVDATGDPGWRAQWLHDRGVLERKLGRFDAALRLFEQALAIHRGQNDQVAVARELNSIGNLHGRTGRFADALLAHNEALRISRTQNDRAETARSLRMLGVLYRNLDDEELGSQHLKEALQHVEERNRREAIALHGEITMSLVELGRLDEAAFHGEQAVTQAERSGSPPNKVNAFSRMAELELARGNAARALHWAERAFEQHDQVALRDQTLLRITRARVWAALGRTAQARAEAETALAATRRLGDRILEREALDVLADQQLALGDAASAFVTRKAHQSLDKELAMDMAGRRIAVLESSLERQRDEAQRALLERDNQIQALTLNRQRLVGIAMAVGLIALLAIAALLYGRYRQSQRGNVRLAASRDELERLHRALLDSARELERVAHTDALTGLANRRAMTEMLQRHLDVAHARDEPVAALLVDVDHFKAINDGHGHLVGDQVLREVARRLGEHLPEGAALGRWGGEEFLVVLAGADPALAQSTGETLRRALADTPLDCGERSIAVTASIGVASLRGARAESMDTLIGAADHALYRAKRAGRNRVEAA